MVYSGFVKEPFMALMRRVKKSFVDKFRLIALYLTKLLKQMATFKGTFNKN